MNLDLSQHKVSPLVMVFLKNGQKILTLKRAAHKQIFPNKLSGFGGKIEPGEDIFTAVHREFTEETGLTITDLKFRGNFIVFMGNGFINILYIFVGTQFTGSLKQNPDEGVISWMDIAGFLNHPDRVDHIGYYLTQVFQDNPDLYVGIANRENGTIVDYTDNRQHFQDRKPK